MNIIGLSKQRNEIESLITDIPSSTKKLSQLICERIILVENEIDKFYKNIYINGLKKILRKENK